MSEEKFKPEWDEDFDEALRIHSAAEAYAVATHYEHGSRYRGKEPTVATSALDVLSHDCALVHRSVAGVSVIGYSSVAPILVRTQLDLMIQTMAITLHDNPELMAYKYMYFMSKKGINDLTFPEAERDRAKRTALEGMERVPEPLREEAKQFVFKDKLGSYWYASEYGGPKGVLEEYMRGWEKIYDGLSAAAHGGYLGIRMFRDDPDKFDLEPRRPGLAAQRILSFSARFMLDQTLHRAHFFELEAEAAYPELRKQVDELQKRVGEPQITDEERRTLPTHMRIRPTIEESASVEQVEKAETTPLPAPKK